MSEPIEFLFLYEAVEAGYRNEKEREFLTALKTYTAKLSQFGLMDEDCYVSTYDDSVLMTAFDITKQSSIVSSSRVDFTGTSILMCDLGAGSNLFDSLLVDNDTEVKVYREANCSPSFFANLATEWLFNEFSRSR